MTTHIIRVKGESGLWGVHPMRNLFEALSIYQAYVDTGAEPELFQKVDPCAAAQADLSTLPSSLLERLQGKTRI